MTRQSMSDADHPDAAGTAPRHRWVACASPQGLHRMAYTEWGERDNARVLICVHGLTRVGRDFDYLAARLSERYRVICPDVVGRGMSDWLKDPAGYAVPQYVADMVTLIARLDVPAVHWLGTSMGGLIGIVLAALPGSPIERLILNDVGPVIEQAALARIGDYVGQTPEFANMDEAITYVRGVSAPFALENDAQWRFITEHAVRPTQDGRLRLHYDPAIAAPFRTAFAQGGVDLWPMYDAIRCPTLVMRGERSDLLSHATAAAMCARGPRAGLREIPGVGHAPMFMNDAQVAVVREFLLAQS
ncbi:MAG: hypothetical protein AMXMBFR6_14290 [Betaproteobacteria bacterium]|nr:alpha/beta hydrolase [Rhodocyclaceae bacterium]MCG3187091.1 2-succinyl-6-hydroxy-2,4-cyclohexadiene-1-carboxylate synthase [Rhodocyclaceae bacterium]